MLADWNDLFSRIINIKLEDREDTILWNYDHKGVYTVKSFCNIINFRGIHPGNLPVIWKINVPLRIQIFLWLLVKNKLLTRDNLQKNTTCRRCYLSFLW